MRDDKNGLTHVFVAMGAIVFFVAAVPALDAMGTYVANWFGLKSVKLNHEAEEFVHEEPCQETHAIGFTVPSEEEEEYIEDE